MIKFITTLLSFILHIPVYAQQSSTTQKPFIATSETLASEIGKTYQRAKNCGHDLSNLSNLNTSNLFRKYLNENEIKIVMQQFERSVTKENGKACNLEEINVQTLISKIGNYMRIAVPHIRPQTK